LLGSGNAITQKLKQTTAKFAKAIEEPYNTSKQETIKLAQEIEGLITDRGNRQQLGSSFNRCFDRSTARFNA